MRASSSWQATGRYQNHDDEAAGAAAGGGAAPGSERRHACATALASGSPLRAS